MDKSKNKTQNSTNIENRTETIQVKVSPSEHEQIRKRAEEAGFGSKVSPYIRSQALHPCATSFEGKLRQEIATLLCRYAQLVEMVDNSELRLEFVKWGKAAWQSIKS